MQTWYRSSLSLGKAAGCQRVEGWQGPGFVQTTTGWGALMDVTWDRAGLGMRKDAAHHGDCHSKLDHPNQIASKHVNKKVTEQGETGNSIILTHQGEVVVFFFLQTLYE